ncbi:MAG: metal ABC transporter substrate-binding protein [Clostridia bacterium]
MKRIMTILVCACLLTGCAAGSARPSDSGKLKIVATLFPQYDFAREIAGDAAEVTLLLPPGAESHSYEPSPADVMAINQADLFIYTGDAMEAWVAPLLDSLEGDPAILNISEGIELHEPVHETAQDEANHDHDHDVDPHVFTNPRFAIQMAENLENKLGEIDPAGREAYKARGAAYRAELAALDQEFRDIVASAKNHKLIFGGRFAFLYFTEEYGLTYDAAYDSCSSEAEPSAADMARLIDTVRKENIPVVYYEELSNPKTARLICEETGAKPLLLHSCHNISKDELKNGATYLSLMQMNAAHLKEGLN